VTPHRLTLRVYYEDTDLAGIVYHANFLKFAERGRTEALRAAGVDQGRLKAERGLVFVIASMRCDWRRPGRFDDLLTVETGLIRLGGATVDLGQRVLRGDETLFDAEARLAPMGEDGRARRLPADLREALSAGLGG
jgi:acyl-CoA thioester hydrolase